MNVRELMSALQVRLDPDYAQDDVEVVVYDEHGALVLLRALEMVGGRLRLDGWRVTDERLERRRKAGHQ